MVPRWVLGNAVRSITLTGLPVAHPDGDLVWAITRRFLREHRIPLVSSFALFIVGSAFFLRTPVYRWVPFIPDDSFYYLSIARNVWRYGSFSYDGFDRSYGFQPLWQLLLIPIAGAFPETVGFLAVTVLFSFFLFILTGFLLYVLVRRYLGASPALLAMLIWDLNPALLRDFPLTFKENVLLAPLLLLTLFALEAALAGSLRASYALGILLGLVWTTRFNALLFAAVILLFAAFRLLRESGRNGARVGAAILGSFLLSSLPWYGFASMYFGSVMPYSGVVKVDNSRALVTQAWCVDWLSWDHFLEAIRRGLPLYVEAYEAWYKTVGSAIAIPLVLLALPVVVTAAHRGVARDRGFSALLRCVSLLAAYAVCNALLTFILLPDWVGYGRWYFAPDALLCPLIVAMIWHVASARALSGPAVWVQVVSVVGIVAYRTFQWNHGSASAPLKLCVAVAVLLAFSGAALGDWRTRFAAGGLRTAGIVSAVGFSAALATYAGTGSYLAHRFLGRNLPRQMFEVALLLRERLPPETVFAATDTGVFGYFSGFRVLNMEGLMNSLEYHRNVTNRPEALVEYLRDRNVEYLLGTAFEAPDRSNWVYLFAQRVPLFWAPLWIPFPEGPIREKAGWWLVLSSVLPEPSLEPGALSGFGRVLQGGRDVVLTGYVCADGSVRPVSDDRCTTLNFEDAGFRGWELEGPAFGSRPSTAGPAVRQLPVSGVEGKYFVNGFAAGGDALTGKMRSAPFRLRDTLFSLRIGGGSNLAKVGVRVLRSGRPIALFTGRNSEELSIQTADLSRYHGDEVQVEIYDDATGPWGHVLVDDIQLHKVIP